MWQNGDSKPRCVAGKLPEQAEILMHFAAERRSDRLVNFLSWGFHILEIGLVFKMYHVFWTDIF